MRARAKREQGRREVHRRQLRTAELLAEVELVAISLDVHADELERLLDDTQPDNPDSRPDAR